MAEPRSLLPTVRNPLLALPAMQRLAALLAGRPELRAAVLELLLEIRNHARASAQLSWRRNKGPMALYWKVVGVYAGHILRAIRSA